MDMVHLRTYSCSHHHATFPKTGTSESDNIGTCYDSSSESCRNAHSDRSHILTHPTNAVQNKTTLETHFIYCLDLGAILNPELFGKLVVAGVHSTTLHVGLTSDNPLRSNTLSPTFHTSGLPECIPSTL